MPSNITTPAAFAYTAGSLRGNRIAPALFRYSASTTLVSSKDSSTSSAVTVPQLDRLTRRDQIPGESEESFLRRAAVWQKTMLAIETALEATNAKVNDNSAILARLLAVETVAEAANDNANAAQAAATAVQTATQQTFNDIDPVYSNSFNERVELD